MKKIRVGVSALCANKTSGLQESKSWPYPTRKTRLCAHQPVPWKGMNERGAEESFLTDSDKLKVLGSQNHMRHPEILGTTLFANRYPSRIKPMVSFFPSCFFNCTTTKDAETEA